MIGHLAIGPYGHAEAAAGFREPIPIEGIVAVLIEYPLAAVAALRDVVRSAWNDNAGDLVKYGRVTVIPDCRGPNWRRSMAAAVLRDYWKGKVCR